MTRELHCIGYLGPLGYAQVTRIGAVWRVYAGRTSDDVALVATCSDEADAYDVARRKAWRERRAA